MEEYTPDCINAAGDVLHHWYHMSDGSEAYCLDRQPKGHEPRFLVWHRTKSGRRVPGKGRRDPVLYNLPAVIAAITAGIEVWFCEGEKDADALISLGQVATTTLGGAGTVPDRLASLLAGAHLRVLLDDDGEGRARAALVHRVVARSVESLQFFLPATGPDTDGHDHFVDAGLGVDELVRYHPKARASAKPSKSGSPAKSVLRHRMVPPTADVLKQRMLDQLRHAVIGTRNDTLYTVSRYLLQFAYGGVYPIGGLRSELETVALDLGLPRREIRDTLASADRKARDNPREWVQHHFRSELGWLHIARVTAAAGAVYWEGKHAKYLCRVLRATICVLVSTPFEPDDFPASVRDIAKAANTTSLSTIR